MPYIVGLWATINKMSNLENAEFHDFLLTQFFYTSNLDILWKVTPKLINHTIFWKNLKSLFTILFSFRCT